MRALFFREFGVAMMDNRCVVAVNFPANFRRAPLPLISGDNAVYSTNRRDFMIALGTLDILYRHAKLACDKLEYFRKARAGPAHPTLAVDRETGPVENFARLLCRRARLARAKVFLIGLKHHARPRHHTLYKLVDCTRSWFAARLLLLVSNASALNEILR
jgi:hypothetical protein